MATVELTASRSAGRSGLAARAAALIDPPAVAAWTLAFSLVAYLALSNGGYDTIVRDQVGVALWWIVLLGAVAGLLPRRVPRAGWAAIALLGAFAAWTGLATQWSESAERTVVELARVSTYLGVLVLAVCVQGRTAARHTVNGLACAMGVVVALAVLSRLHPQWFPVNDHLEFLGPSNARKLSYPLNYWNGLAAFAAMGVPLLAAVAVGARTLLGQAVAAAALPLAALCAYLTLSRGGALALVAGVVALVLLAPRRPALVAALGAGGVGAAILIAAASSRDALQNALSTPVAFQQGDELLALAAIVCLCVGLAQVALGLAARHVTRPRWAALGRRTTAAGAVAGALLLGVVAVAAGAPGAVDRRWQEFKAPPEAPALRGDVFGRLQATGGNGRYQIWQAALDANATDRWKGIGPGTFEFWWARHNTTGVSIRDAHNLYVETLAEAGIVGLLLLAGLFAWLVTTAVRRLVGEESEELRLTIAAASSAIVAFMVAAALDWVWEVAVLPVIVMVLGGVVVAGRSGRRRRRSDYVPAPAPAAPRVGVALLSLAALVAVGLSLAGASAVRDSRAANAAGRLTEALADARSAQRLQPYAGTPRLQQALVLERAGDLAAAASAARAATTAEPTNWRGWLVLARIENGRGDDDAALRAVARLRVLNPRLTLLSR